MEEPPLPVAEPETRLSVPPLRSVADPPSAAPAWTVRLLPGLSPALLPIDHVRAAVPVAVMSVAPLIAPAFVMPPLELLRLASVPAPPLAIRVVPLSDRLPPVIATSP